MMRHDPQYLPSTSHSGGCHQHKSSELSTSSSLHDSTIFLEHTSPQRELIEASESTSGQQNTYIYSLTRDYNAEEKLSMSILPAISLIRYDGLHGQHHYSYLRESRAVAKAPRDPRYQEMKYPCGLCKPSVTVFKTRDDLDRHLQAVHYTLKPGDRVWKCDIQDCPVAGKIWMRLDTFKQHVISMHGALDVDTADKVWVKNDPEEHDAGGRGSGGRVLRFRNSLNEQQLPQAGSPCAEDSGLSPQRSRSVPIHLSANQPEVLESNRTLCEQAPGTSSRNSFKGASRASEAESDHKEKLTPERLRFDHNNHDERLTEYARIFLEQSPQNRSKALGTTQESETSVNSVERSTGVSPGPAGSSTNSPCELTSQTTTSPFSSGEISFIGYSTDEDDSTTGLNEVGLFGATQFVLIVSFLHQRSQGGSGASSGPGVHDTNSASSRENDATGHPVHSDPDRGKHGRKRTLSKTNEDEEQSGSNSEPSTSKRVKRSHLEQKTFACPFHKADPLKYSAQNSQHSCYRGCGSCVIRSIPALKQHLYRIHKKPDTYCASWYSTFSTSQARDDHVRARSCSIVRVSPFTDKMSDLAYETIKTKRRAKDPEATWYQIFRVLFPDLPKPRSP